MVIRPFRTYSREFKDSLWFRPAFYCGLAIAAVFFCWAVQRLGFPLSIDAISKSLVSKLLSIITTSMLTVSTFAVGSMVAAYASASTAGTPRVFALIIADDNTQNAASSFIGAFIFGVIATIGIESGVFNEDSGLLLLFLVTVGIFIWVIGTFIVWIDNIARLGQIGTSIQKSEQAAGDALARVINSPYLGGARLSSGAHRSSDGVPVHPEKFGYLSRIDMEALQTIGEKLDTSISIWVRLGALVDPSVPIATIDERTGSQLAATMQEDGLIEQVQNAFQISDDRSFLGDPAFSLTVLGEIAAKALSPGVNDPGTALTVINAVTRQLADWLERSHDIDEPEYPRVLVPAIQNGRLVRAGFDLIARYGVADAEVVLHMLIAFRYLANAGDDEFATEMNDYARALLEEAERELTDREFSEIVSQCPSAWIS